LPIACGSQYCGALGKRANCQVAVSVHAASDTASCPLQWRLFLSQEWAADTERRSLTRIPPEVGHREKWRLALDMLDTLADWGMRPPVVVADAAYGTNVHLRAGLTQRGIDYVLAIRAEVSAHRSTRSR
jgi:SRSO17 transposase